MRTINKGLQVRIYPNKTLEKKLRQNIGDARFVWNQLLSLYNKYYKMGYNFHPNMKTFHFLLNRIKSRYNFLKDSDAHSLQQVYRDLIKGFQKFFKEKNAGHPRFKSKKHPKQSYRTPNGKNVIRVEGNRLRIPKHGFVTYRTSREYKKLLEESKIVNCTIKLDKSKWYAVVNVETPIDNLPHTGRSVGVDLGVKNLATLSNGEKIANLSLKREEQVIKKYQRSMSRKKYGSQNYLKALRKYHKWVAKRKNKLEDYYHKISTRLVREYDIIGMETLNILGMKGNKRLAPSLQKIGLYKLLEMIRYKCSWYGRDFRQVGRYFPSSKLCSNCGTKKDDLTLSMREWTCNECKETHDRDVNAAINILNEVMD